MLNDTVWRVLQRGQMPSVKESTGLIPSSELRPDGASTQSWARGRCLAWDVTAPDTLAQCHLQASVGCAGAAAAKAEATKVAKYAALSSTHVFVPLAFETLGEGGSTGAGQGIRGPTWSANHRDHGRCARDGLSAPAPVCRHTARQCTRNPRQPWPSKRHKLR